MALINYARGREHKGHVKGANCDLWVAPSIPDVNCEWRILVKEDPEVAWKDPKLVTVKAKAAIGKGQPLRLGYGVDYWHGYETGEDEAEDTGTDSE